MCVGHVKTVLRQAQEPRANEGVNQKTVQISKGSPAIALSLPGGLSEISEVFFVESWKNIGSSLQAAPVKDISGTPLHELPGFLRAWGSIVLT